MNFHNSIGFYKNIVLAFSLVFNLIYLVSDVCNVFSDGEASNDILANVTFIMPMKVLIVGTGITSAVTAVNLRKAYRKNVRLYIWDKARGVGGRMCSSRRTIDSKVSVDLGAQYVTTTTENEQKFSDIYGPLLSNGLLETMKCKTVGMNVFPSNVKHYVAPEGMSSIIKYFLAVAEIDETCFAYHVSHIMQVKNQLLVRTKDGASNIFDAVVLTMPVPQILQLEGDIQNELKSNSEINFGLMSVKFSSRYALVLYFDTAVASDWDVKYINDSTVFRYVAFDRRKKNCVDFDDECAVVFHTSIQYGEKNISSPSDSVKAELLVKLCELFPAWPKPIAVKCHKWRYSQVLKPYPSKPGCIVIPSHALLIAGGDSFVGSNFDNCVQSALNVVERITYQFPT